MSAEPWTSAPTAGPTADGDREISTGTFAADRRESGIGGDASTPAGSSLPASPADATPRPLRAVGYRRVSTREQAEHGASLDHQAETISGECERRGWELLEVLEDPGASGKNMKRPGLARALELLAAGDADVLVAAKLDRLSRSTLDFAVLAERSKKEGWQMLLLDINLDTTTPYGEAMATMAAVFAQLERRLIGQRTRDGLAVKRAQGVRLGRPSKLPADVVAKIRRHREDGLTLSGIAAELNDAGVPTSQGGARWYASTVRAILARTVE